MKKFYNLGASSLIQKDDLCPEKDTNKYITEENE